jgi:hypothetical protein
MYQLSDEQKDEWLNTIEFDLTTFCNLSCQDCAHGCDKFPSKDYLSTKQVYEFVQESLARNKKWKKIGLLGGEPTEHRYLSTVLIMLREYYIIFPDTNIWIMTNGINKQLIGEMQQIHPWLNIIINTDHSYHHAFYVSPTDEGLLGSNTRCEALHCGVGLGPYGFTPCVLGTTMHRIFGYETIKSLKELTYTRCMSMFPEYCQHCGWYLVDSDCREEGRIWSYERGYMSENWKKIYELKGDNK